MACAAAMMNESVWFNQFTYEEDEAKHQLRLSGCAVAAETKTGTGASHLVEQIVKARENIQQSLASTGTTTSGSSAVSNKQVDDLVKENANLRKLVEQLTLRVDALEGKSTSTVLAAAPSQPAPEEDDDDDIDLFGSDDEDEKEAERIKAERIQAYNERKATKKVVIAKSSLLLDVKPWSDETDMAEVERLVRTIEMDGLLWGPIAKLIPLAYGIKKLQIPCVIEDEKVSTDDLEEKITAFDDLVQSMDIAAFNKV